MNHVQRFYLVLLATGWVCASAGESHAQILRDSAQDYSSWESLLDPGAGALYPSQNELAPRASAVPRSIPQAAPPRVSTVRPTVAARPTVPAAPSRQVQNLIDFYGGATSARALSQLPNRPSSGVSRSPQPQFAAKPFQRASPAPTLSPYLNLYREEGGEAVPNYHIYVRPQLQQQATNRRQQFELSRLERQVQAAQRDAAGANSTATPSTATPWTGHGTRYFNTAQFYKPAGGVR